MRAALLGVITGYIIFLLFFFPVKAYAPVEQRMSIVCGTSVPLDALVDATDAASFSNAWAQVTAATEAGECFSNLPRTYPVQTISPVGPPAFIRGLGWHRVWSVVTPDGLAAYALIKVKVT